MKPVTQSKVGAHGRCFPACVASILEVPESSVPGYEDMPDVYQWLERRGLQYAQAPIEGTPAPVGYHIIEGISPRGGQHAVVGLNGKTVHDPHPQDGTGRGLTKPERWGMLLPVKSEARDSMLSGLALQAAITPVYTRHNEIKATPRRSWQEVSRLLGETKALLDASRISDKTKWQTVLANASSFLAMARDAERQGDNPHFVGWTERAFMMTHHVLDALEGLARRTTARDEDKPWGNWTAEELKLHNKVLRAFPSSPRQKELKRRLEELRAKNPAVRKDARRTTARDEDKFDRQAAEYVQRHNAASKEYKAAFKAVGARMWPMDYAHELKPYNQQCIAESARRTGYRQHLPRPLTVLNSYPDVTPKQRKWLNAEVDRIYQKYGGKFGRDHAKDTHWEPGTGDVKRQWFDANAPYGPGDLIKLPNGKIAEVTKCLLGENLFHEPEYHVSTKTGECVVVPVKTRSKDRCAPARLHRALDAVLDSAYAKDKAPFTEDRKLTDLAEKVQRMYLAAPNTYDGIAAVKEKMRKEIAAAGITPGHLAQYITKMSTHLGRRSNVNHIKNL